MSNESESETARAMIAVLSAEPPAAMVALALRELPVSPEIARRMAALGCALQVSPLDLGAQHLDDEPAAEIAVRFEKWLAGRAGDPELLVLSLHFASLMLAGDQSGHEQVETAAGFLHQWLTRGKTKRPMGGY